MRVQTSAMRVLTSPVCAVKDALRHRPRRAPGAKSTTLA
jgi:hypothetical protein